MRLLRYIGRNWLIVLAALVSGGIIHVAAVLATPWLVVDTAYSRMARLSPVNEMIILPPVTADEQPLPFMAADVRYAICRYDLSVGPLTVRTPLADESWSISLYNTLGENFYTLTGSDLQRPDVELILAPAENSASGPLPLGRETQASAITVSVGNPEGLLMIRAPVRGSSYVDEIEKAMQVARCESREEESAGEDRLAVPQ